MAITTTPETTLTTKLPMPAGFPMPNGDMTKQAEAVRSSLTHGAQAMQTELMRFMGEQMRAGSDMLQQMLKCAGPMELMQLQQHWLTTSTKSYTDEMMKLTQLATEMGTSATKAS